MQYTVTKCCMVKAKRQCSILQKNYRKHVFPSHHVLEHMDYAGGVLNSAGVDLVREMEISKLPILKQKKNFRAILPSKAATSLAARTLEKVSQLIIPFESFSMTSVEGVKFTDMAAAVQTIIRAHGIHEVAKWRQVEFRISLDAAPIRKSLSHVTLMLTLIDAVPWARVPRFRFSYKVSLTSKLQFLLCF
jgi:hypothetical protein